MTNNNNNFYISNEELSIDSNLKIITLKNTGWTIQIDPTYCEKELRQKLSPEWTKELEEATMKLAEERSLAYWRRIETHGALQLECDKCKNGYDKAIYHPKTREIYCDSCFELIKEEGILEANHKSKGNHDFQECESKPNTNTLEYFKNPDYRADITNFADKIKNGEHFTIHGKLDPESAKRFKETTEKIITKHESVFPKEEEDKTGWKLGQLKYHTTLHTKTKPPRKDKGKKRESYKTNRATKLLQKRGIEYHQAKTIARQARQLVDENESNKTKKRRSNNKKK